MPKKTVRASADVPTPAAPPADPVASVIAKARGNSTAVDIPAAAVEALRKLCQYNDTLNPNDRTRVSSGAAINMLRDHYGVGMSATSTDSFNLLCRRVLGRQSWGKP